MGNFVDIHGLEEASRSNRSWTFLDHMLSVTCYAFGFVTIKHSDLTPICSKHRSLSNIGYTS